MTKTFLTLLYGGLLVILIPATIFVLKEALDLPIVEISLSTGQCVRVIQSVAHDCDNLPLKYEHVWVQ